MTTRHGYKVACGTCGLRHRSWHELAACTVGGRCVVDGTGLSPPSAAAGAGPA
jgi:hypothetical protein